MDMTINNPCWKQVKAPWKTEESPKVAVAASA
jgi:nitrogenase molybdenum-iron protein alpha chain